MIPINLSSLSSSVLEERFNLDSNSADTNNGTFIYSYNSARDIIAICQNNVLSAHIVTTNEMLFELEFDYSIQAIDMDPAADCIIIGDSSGSLHFVTITGCLILSRRVATATIDTLITPSFLQLKLITTSSTSPDVNDDVDNDDCLKAAGEGERNCLLAVLTDGAIIGISLQVSMKRLCDTEVVPRLNLAAANVSVMKQFINDANVVFPVKCAQVIFNTNSDKNSSSGEYGSVILHMLFQDSNDNLFYRHIGSTSRLNYDSNLISTESSSLPTHCLDFTSLFDPATGACVYVAVLQGGGDDASFMIFDMCSTSYAPILVACTQLEYEADKIAFVSYDDVSHSDKSTLVDEVQRKRGCLISISLYDSSKSILSTLCLSNTIATAGRFLDRFISFTVEVLFDFIGIVVKSSSRVWLPEHIRSTNNSFIKLYSRCDSLIDLFDVSLVTDSVDNLHHQYTVMIVSYIISREGDALSPSLFDKILSLKTSADVIAVLNAVLYVYDLLHGSVSSDMLIKVLTVLQVAIDSEYCMTSSKSHSYYIKKVFEVTTSISKCCTELPAGEISLLSVTSAAAARKEWLRVSLCGCFLDASIIARLIVDQESYDILPDAVTILSHLAGNESIHINSVVSFILGDVLPTLTGDLRTKTDMVYELAQLVSDYAVEFERRNKNPFESISAIRLAAQIIDTVASCTLNSRRREVIRRVAVLQHNLQIQSNLWLKWEIQISLDAIMNVGLQEIIFNELLQLAVAPSMSEEIRDSIRPLAMEFELNLDDVLCSWIRRSLCDKVFIVVTDENVDSASDDDSDSDGDEIERDELISRLVYAVNSIEDVGKKRQMMLHLFQLPHIDRLQVSVSSANVTCAEYLHDMIVHTLSLADSDSTSVEELRETIRLYRMKVIAAAHGIVSFNPRDMTQVKAAVSLISASACPSSLRDALYFVQSWSSCSYDETSLYSRAIVHRLTACVTDHEDSSSTDASIVSDEMSIDSYVRDIVSIIPSARLCGVVEEVCGYLLASLNELVRVVDGEIKEKQRASIYVHGAIGMTAMYLDVSNRVFDRQSNVTWITPLLLVDLKRLRALQVDADIYISLHDIRSSDRCRSIIRSVAVARSRHLADSSCQYDVCGSVSTTTSTVDIVTPTIIRMCSILNISLVYFMYTVMHIVYDRGYLSLTMQVASSLMGLLKGSEQQARLSHEDSSLLLDASILLSTVSTHVLKSRGGINGAAGSVLNVRTCTDSFHWSRDILTATSAACTRDSLGHVVNHLSNAEFAISVCSRIENNTGTVTSGSSSSSSSGTFKINETNFPGTDGLLMPTSLILQPLFKYALNELRRKSSFRSDAIVDAIGTEQKGKHAGAISIAADVTDLVTVLQKHENYVLASRLLFSTWSISSDVSKGMLTRSCVTQLSRKILSYRDIDISLATSCLIMLPYDSMVKELKAAIPAIQSDFARLQVVAVVGEDMARLWSQEDLLNVFQGLQINAKWWCILSSIGVKIDPRTFQSSDDRQRETAIRGVIAPLLEKSNFDLDKAIDYCRQFDIEQEFASLCYIDMVVTSPPSYLANHVQQYLPLSSSASSIMTGIDTRLAVQINKASENIREDILASTLKRLLMKIHPLDYEKIRFVCFRILSYCDDDDDGTEDSPIDQMAQRSNQSSTDATVSTSESSNNRMYRQFIDVTTFLSNLLFPSNSIATLPAFQPIYSGLPVVYSSRLPLWQLFESPWGIIEELLLSEPVLASKLSFLCATLGINRDDFFVKKITILYASGTHTSIDFVMENCASISSIYRKVEVWRWIFDTEKSSPGCYDNDKCSTALTMAITLIDSQLLQAGGDDEGLVSIQIQLIDQLVVLRCEDSLHQLKRKTLASISSISSSDNRALHRPTLTVVSGIINTAADPGQIESMYMRVLETAIEISWLLQLHSIKISMNRRSNSCLCIEDVWPHMHSAVVIEYLSHVQDILHGLQQHLRLPEQFTFGHKASTDASTADTSTSSLEAVRLTLINKLLSDVDPSGNANASAASSVTASCTMWGCDENSDISPTPAELRRREDVYLAFAISILIESVAASSTHTDSARTDAEGTVTNLKVHYLTHLDMIARSKAKNTRRLTTRSRLRAAQALAFSRSTSTLLPVPSIAVDGRASADIGNLRSFLFCWAELHEIRLPYSEDALLQSLTNPTANPTVIRTWLHDEGTHVEVSELSRDLLVESQSTEIDVWELLLMHMNEKHQYRPLFQTMVVIRERHFFTSTLCKLPNIASMLLFTIGHVSTVAVNKIEQLIDLLSSRKSVCNTSKDDKAASAHSIYRGYFFIQQLQGSSAVDNTTPEDLLLLVNQLEALWSVASTKVVPFMVSDCLRDMQHMQEIFFRLYSIVIRYNKLNSSNSSTSIQSDDSSDNLQIQSVLTNACELFALSLLHPSLAISGANKKAVSVESQAALLIPVFSYFCQQEAAGTWNVYKKMCDAFQNDAVTATLTELFFRPSINVYLLPYLLHEVSVHWNDDTCSQKASTLLFVWIANISSEAFLETLRLTIIKLNIHDKKQLRIAISTLSKRILNLDERNKLFVHCNLY